MNRLTRLRTKLARLRPLLFIRHLMHAPRLLRNRSLYKRYGVGKPVFSTIAARDVTQRVQADDELPWLDRPDAASALAADPGLERFPEPIRESIRSWPEEGYAVLESFFAPELIDQINVEIAEQLEHGKLGFNLGGDRVRNVFKRCPSAGQALTDPQLTDVLSYLLGRDVGIWQSISFFRGSRQGAHSDAFHMTTAPPGNLIVIWIALEDVSADSGPVFYVPGTHKLKEIVTEDLALTNGSKLFVSDKTQPYYERIKQQVRESGRQPVRFLAKKGDVLIWHSNLLHGGGPITNPESTRRSLVAHYYGKDTLRWHEVSEHPSFI